MKAILMNERRTVGLGNGYIRLCGEPGDDGHILIQDTDAWVIESELRLHNCFIRRARQCSFGRVQDSTIESYSNLLLYSEELKTPRLRDYLLAAILLLAFRR